MAAAFDSGFDTSFDIEIEDSPGVDSGLSVSTVGGLLTSSHTDGDIDL